MATPSGLATQRLLEEMQTLLKKLKRGEHIEHDSKMWAHAITHFEYAIELVEFPRDYRTLREKRRQRLSKQKERQ